MLYIASPYSSPIEGAQELRYREARNFVRRCLGEGLAAYSPIVYCHPLAQEFQLPGDAAFWHNFNMAMLRKAEAVFLLQLPGWDTSKGVAMELRMAKLLNIEVQAFSPDFEPVPYAHR